MSRSEKGEKLKLAALFSGGKDSTYALKCAYNSGHSISVLVTIYPQVNDSYMFHVPNLSMVPLLSETLSIPLEKGLTTGIKEEEVKDLENVLKNVIYKYGINGVVSGAIASNYQKSRIDSICKRLGIVSYTPLWGLDQEKYLEKLIDENYKIMLVGVYAEGLDKSFLGRIIDKNLFLELKRIRDRYKINIAGEGGEYETIVLDCPMYKKPLLIEDYHTIWTGSSGYIQINQASLGNSIRAQ